MLPRCVIHTASSCTPGPSPAGVPAPARARAWAVALCLGATLLAASAHARPDLASRRMVGPLVVFADDARADLFHVLPPEPEVATGPDGRPDLALLSLRYTGNALSRDRGLALHRTVLTLRVKLPPHARADLDRAARALASGGREPELRPLPIRRIESAVVFAPIGRADSTARVLPGGDLVADGSADGAAWNERVFTLALDSLSAQVLQAALARDQLAMSFAWAFVADGRVANEPFGDVQGPPELVRALRERLAAAADSAGRDSTSRRVVRAGAFRIGVDLRTWPGVVRRVDVDAQAPAGFAAIDVYCFDFRDVRRPDLFEKRVEIEAESVGGRPVRQQAVFARERPDVFAVGLRFPVAVRLDRPYRFRVVESRPDGTSTTGPWQPGRAWLALLDVTTTIAPARGVRPIR